MTNNDQINCIVFDVDNINRALDSAADLIRYDDKARIEERIEVVLYAIKASIDRLHTAHNRLEDALRMLRREKQCGEEEGKNAENGENSQ